MLECSAPMHHAHAPDPEHKFTLISQKPADNATDMEGPKGSLYIPPDFPDYHREFTRQFSLPDSKLLKQLWMDVFPSIHDAELLVIHEKFDTSKCSHEHVPIDLEVIAKCTKAAMGMNGMHEADDAAEREGTESARQSRSRSFMVPRASFEEGHVRSARTSIRHSKTLDTKTLDLLTQGASAAQDDHHESLEPQPVMSARSSLVRFSSKELAKRASDASDADSICKRLSLSDTHDADDGSQQASNSPRMSMARHSVCVDLHGIHDAKRSSDTLDALVSLDLMPLPKRSSTSRSPRPSMSAIVEASEFDGSKGLSDAQEVQEGVEELQKSLEDKSFRPHSALNAFSRVEERGLDDIRPPGAMSMRQGSMDSDVKSMRQGSMDSDVNSTELNSTATSRLESPESPCDTGDTYSEIHSTDVQLHSSDFLSSRLNQEAVARRPGRARTTGLPHVSRHSSRHGTKDAWAIYTPRTDAIYTRPPPAPIMSAKIPAFPVPVLGEKPRFTRRGFKHPPDLGGHSVLSKRR